MRVRWTALLFSCLLLVGSTVQANDRHVVVICVDGLPAYLLDDEQVPLPAIRALARSGVQAEGMIPANPSVTWPNHTSMTTGVWPERHGVLFNGVLERPGPGLPVVVNPRKDQQEMVFAPTIYDVAHEGGLKTAAINWPCTRNSTTLDDNMPDVPEALDHSTPRLLEALGLNGDERAKFNKQSALVRDGIWTDAACQVIAEHKPNLMFVHLLNVDGTHHKYGPKTPAGNTAVAFADTFVARIVKAIDDAGIRDKTTIFVVSDHGFQTIPKTIQPNVVLRKGNLLTVEGGKLTAARVHAVPEGGIAMVYATVPETREQDLAAARKLFEATEGVAEVVLPDQFEKYGLPQPADYPQMADMVVAAKDGYGFSATATGDDDVIASTATLGTHGFLSNNPLMRATFIASGPGVPEGKRIGVVNNIDLTPTIARLLDIPFPDATGKDVLGNLAR